MPVDKVLLADLQEAAKAADLKPIVTVDEAAEFTRTHHRTIRRWIREGRLSAAKSHPGSRGNVLIVRDKLLELLASPSSDVSPGTKALRPSTLRKRTRASRKAA
jgi:excisionase family DNA binding protein